MMKLVMRMDKVNNHDIQGVINPNCYVIIDGRALNHHQIIRAIRHVSQA